jgi:hypothetical protein
MIPARAASSRTTSAVSASKTTRRQGLEATLARGGQRGGAERRLADPRLALDDQDARAVRTTDSRTPSISASSSSRPMMSRVLVSTLAE